MKFPNNRGGLLTWLVLLFALLLTGFLSYRLKINVENAAQREFERRCDEIKFRIEARLEVHKQILLGGAALFDASQEVTREEWRIYVHRLSLDRHFNGIQALGFALWIPPEELKTHEVQFRKSGFPDYRVKPEGQRNAYTSIIYIEPFDTRNQRAFGYDMYSEPIRHAAMRRAVDNNDAYLSGKVTLLQETDSDIQAGTLMYLPIYQKNKPIETIEQRRAAIFGWVYTPFRMTNLLSSIVLNSADINDSNFNLRVYDGAEIRPEDLLYQGDGNDSNTKSLFNSTIQIQFYGRIWTLHMEKYEGTGTVFIDYNKVWIVLGSGTIISFLLFFLLRSYSMVKLQAAKMAFELTMQLRESEKKLTMINADLLQFTNIAAHHLQEPPRRIISFVQRLQNDLTDIISTNEDAAFALKFIEQSALRQRALVRDIQLYLAAIQPRAVVNAVDVASILAKVVAKYTVLIRQTNASIEYGELPSVMIDRPRLYDIFDILLDNALHYRKPDNILKIHIYGEFKEKRVHYYVEDNGIGIPAEYRERVFLVFERLQVNDNQDSTGIGLAIVRRIIESCGGSVSLKETNGGGTTVIFDLPVDT
ncbi:MAG: CHASE domain-containing protein [Methylococcales bacterium]|nr:CHASE domain-containing protein [Methylococcales bacterium]MDD5754640.1 CHASE domain-containing protein [Methylococcales bacterium]